MTANAPKFTTEEFETHPDDNLTRYRVVLAETGEVVDDNGGRGYLSRSGIATAAGRRWEAAKARREAEAQLAAARRGDTIPASQTRPGNPNKGPLTETRLKRALKKIMHYHLRFNRSDDEDIPTLPDDQEAAKAADEIYSEGLRQLLNGTMLTVTMCELITSEGSSDAIREELEILRRSYNHTMPVLHDRRAVCVGRERWNGNDRGALSECWTHETYIDETGDVFYANAMSVTLDGPGGMPRAVYRRTLGDGCFPPSLNMLGTLLPPKYRNCWQTPPEDEPIA